jgi:hypothetical protein
MSWPIAFVLATGIVAGAFLLSGHAGGQVPAAHWAGVGASDGIAWAVNTATGQMRMCATALGYCSDWKALGASRH